MIVYYKKITVWCKYPFQDVVDYRYIAISSNKKKFEFYTFMELPVETSMEDRLKHVQEIFPHVTKLKKL